MWRQPQSEENGAQRSFLSLPGGVGGGEPGRNEKAQRLGRGWDGTMKLMTLNTHSLAEPEYQRKLAVFAQVAARNMPDVIALQEVNQTISQPEAKVDADLGYVHCPGNDVPLRKDNHGLALARLLKEKGCEYYWTWAPAKVGYDIYEEGLAVFSRRPVEKAVQFFISRSHDFHNWKTRKMVGVKAGGMWFYSVHMGWWEDEEEPFASHWDRVAHEIDAHRTANETVWVMGDFNSPAGITGEGWDYVRASGWKDTYDLAKEKDGGITVGKVIDGWKERLKDNAGEMRIDYIWCNEEIDIDKSEVICNGIHDEVVSDHFGVMITKKER